MIPMYRAQLKGGLRFISVSSFTIPFICSLDLVWGITQGRRTYLFFFA